MHIEFVTLTQPQRISTEPMEKSLVDKERQDTFVETRAVKIPFEYQRLNKACQANSQAEILSILNNLKMQLQKNPALTPVGILAFNHVSDIATVSTCTLYHLGPAPHYSPSFLKIENPLKTNQGALRHRETTLRVDGSLSTLEQLYAMLDLYQGDEMMTSKTATIRDVHATSLYQWESTAYKARSVLGVMEMERFIRNVLNFAGIPYIRLCFVEDAKSCSFSFKGKSSGKPDKKSGDDGLPSHDWLTQSDESLFDNMSHDPGKLSKISITDLELTFPLSWGMCREIALHEVGHYIAFLLPVIHKMNRGPEPLSYAEYSTVFAGHGALYCAIYLFLLHHFNIFDKRSLYFNFAKTDIPFFVIESLQPAHIDEQIALFISHKRRNTSYTALQLAHLGKH